jgi:hypothetical protein
MDISQTQEIQTTCDISTLQISNYCFCSRPVRQKNLQKKDVCSILEGALVKRNKLLKKRECQSNEILLK